MEKYKVVKRLGEGAYGVVVKCVNTQNQEVVAIKKMKGQTYSWDQCLKMPEVLALQKLNNSPFIIKIREMIHNKKENEVNIVFEYCEKNLFQEMQDRARKNNSWNEQEIKTVMYQSIAAIHYMHKNGFMHRDVKPENYLINNMAGPLSPELIQIKLADFGLAKDFRGDGSGKLSEYVATRWYRAPELVLRSTTYNQSVDIFALGAIMAELYLGRPIFPGVNELDQLTRIVTVLGTPTISEWPEGFQFASAKGIKIPQVASTSLRSHFASTSRSDISDEAFDLMSKMFKYSSDQRITAAQCLSHEFFRDVSLSLKSMAGGSNINSVNQRRQRNPQRPAQVLDSGEGNWQRASKEGQPLYPLSRGGEASPPVVAQYNTNLAASGSQIIQNSPDQSKKYSSKIGAVASGLVNNRLDQGVINSGSGMTYGTSEPVPNTIPHTSRRTSGPALSAVDNYTPTFNNSLRQSQNSANIQKLEKTDAGASTYAPHMSKYGKGAFGYVKPNSQFDVGKHSVPSPYSNLGPGQASTYPVVDRNQQPAFEVSKETKNPDIIISSVQQNNNGISGQSNGDDFLGKMLNQDGGQYKNMAGPQASKGKFSSKPNILVKHKIANSLGYGGQKQPAEPLTMSQSVGVLPAQRLGSRLDNGLQSNYVKDTKGPYSGQGRGMGGIGQNIMSAVIDYKPGKEGSRASYAAIPVIKPSMIIPAEKGQQPKPSPFSNLGQSLIMSSNTAMYSPGAPSLLPPNNYGSGSRNDNGGTNGGPTQTGDYQDQSGNNNLSQYISSQWQTQQNR